MSRFIALSALSAAVAGVVSPSLAQAHIRLIEPAPRYEIQDFETGIKSCPCGLGGSNRTCNVAADGSDGDRDDSRALTAEAGSTLTLQFDEYVNHSGRFRVAFDPDGADMADFNQTILLDVPDDATENTDTPQRWELTVTLPDMTCDNCTLQLVQAMDGNTTTEVADPAPISSYYTCVDLTLVASGSVPDAPDDEPADDATDESAGDAMDAPEADPASDVDPVAVDVPGDDSSDAMDDGASEPDGEEDVMMMAEAATDMVAADGDDGTESMDLALMPDLGNDVRSSDSGGGCVVGRSTRGDWGAGLSLISLLGLVGLRRRR